MSSNTNTPNINSISSSTFYTTMTTTSPANTNGSKDEIRKQANLRLLQRTCSADICDIISSATHVVLYEWAGSAWTKCDIEGSLFLAVSHPNNAHKLIIMNRNSPTNFQMDVTSNLQLQHQEPYLIFKETIHAPIIDNGGNNDTVNDTMGMIMKIRGVWFHNAEERIAMDLVLQQTIKDLKQQQKQLASVPVGMRSVSAPSSKNHPSNTPPQQQERHVATTSSSSLASSYPTTLDAQTATATLTALLGVTDIKSKGDVTRDTNKKNKISNNMMTPPTKSSIPITNNVVSSSNNPSQRSNSNPTTYAAAAAGTSTSSSNSSVDSNIQPQQPSIYSNNNENGTSGGGVALDKKSLQLALLSLVQDDRFLDLLHSQYLRVVRSRVKKQQQNQQQP